MSDITIKPDEQVPPAEVPEMELFHSHSWWTTYVFSQDAKVIAIQYAATAIGIGVLALILSWIIRIQLAFLELCHSLTHKFITNLSLCME